VGRTLPVRDDTKTVSGSLRVFMLGACWRSRCQEIVRCERFDCKVEVEKRDELQPAEKDVELNSQEAVTSA